MPDPAPVDLTWPGLLAHWTHFAQVSLALPRNAEGQRWRDAVAPIIGLQAVTFALGDLEKLDRAADPAGERALALDKSEILIRTHSSELHALWRGEDLPGELAALIADARRAIAAVRSAGVEWCVSEDTLVADHPADLQALILSSGFRGDVMLPVPGTVLFRREPAAFARGPTGERPSESVLRAIKEFLVDVTRPERVRGPRQVYRQFDFGTGRVRRDLVLPLDVGVVAGQAQLIQVIERGETLRVHLPIPGMSDLKPVPVEFADSIDA